MVPEVVKVRHGTPPIAASGPASAKWPSSGNTGSPASALALRDVCGASTQRNAARSSSGIAEKIAGKSTGANPHCVTSAAARVRRSRLPTSAARKRVLIWTASAPSRAQAKIAARYSAPFGNQSATREPAPMPALRSPPATRRTRSCKACRVSVAVASVTADAEAFLCDHVSNAGSVSGYPAPYVFRISTF